MSVSRTGLFGFGFGGSFTAFMLFLIYARDATAWAILAALFAVATIVFLILLLREQTEAIVETTTPVETPVAPSAAEAYYDYRGDVHDVIDVEGIGPKYAAKLKAAGIESTARLIYVGADEVASICDVPKKTAEKWIAMCQLIKVNGIGKQYAEALVRGGVMTIQELKRGDPDILASKVSTYLEGLDSTVLGQKVTSKRVAGWQKKAATMRRVRSPVPEA